MLTSNTILQGRYRIDCQIGGGGMGAVYRAYDSRLGNQVCAIKEFSPAQVAPLDRQWQAQAFQQEAQMLAALDHPGLVSVSDYFSEQGNWYLVMDYVQGQTLENWLTQYPQGLQVDIAVNYVTQLCNVLEYLHGQPRPVIFRDLKPANIMITDQGSIKLIDFGIARFFKQGQAHNTVNLGTPGYASPEHGGKGQADQRSDIYSLGVVLHELVTGYDPTRSSVPYQLPPARRVNPAVPAQVEAVIQRATQLSPDQRFQSVAEFREALIGRVIVSVPAVVHPTTPYFPPANNRYRIPANRITVLILLGILVGGAVFGGAIVASLSTPPSTPTVVTPIVIQPTATSTATPTVTPSPTPTFTATITPTAVVVLTPHPSLIPTVEPALPFSPSPVALVIAIAGLALAVVLIVSFARMTNGGNSQSSTTAYTSGASIPATPPQVPPVKTTGFSHGHPSIVLPPEIQEGIKHSSKNPIERLAMYEDYKRLAAFITHDEGGRFVLTGYGRFGGTSLVRAAAKQAKDRLRESGQGEAALLVFNFNVKEDETRIGQFDISANDFQFGILTPASSVTDLDLKAHGQAIDSSTYSFGLTQPLGVAFLGKAENFSYTKRSGFDLPRLVRELQAYFDSGKKPNELQRIVLRLTKSDTLPSRVIIILDRVRHIETIEALANLDLFQNDRISVLAVAHKEDFDCWKNSEHRLDQLGFKKWYVPCLWQSRSDFMQEIRQVFSQPGIPPDPEETAILVLKHFEYVGKGVLGEVLDGIKHPQNWTSDDQGNLAMFLDELARKPNVQHDAWLQTVLELNWNSILGNRFSGRHMDEAIDRARLGVYYLLDWIDQENTFTRNELLIGKESLPITISDKTLLAEEVAYALLQVLVCNGYLKQNGHRYRKNWNPASPPEPKTIAVEVDLDIEPPTPTLKSEPELVKPTAPASPASGGPSMPSTMKVEINERDGRTIKITTQSQGEVEMSKKCKILVVFANPKGSSDLRLGEEDRTIRECIERSKHRDHLQLVKILHAARISDVQRALLEDSYGIVHFSGHGTKEGRLVLEDEGGNSKLVPPQALATLLSRCESLQCVVLNACYSVGQGKLISLGVPFTIGMEGPILDKAATLFSRGFYDAIGAGKDYRAAYDAGCDAIALEMDSVSEERRPQLLTKD